MAKKWFTADKHHNHTNIIQYENRPFKSVETMDKRLILEHNKLVKEEDICYDLGDFCFSSGITISNLKPEIYLNQYNGRYVIIKGNHDGRNRVLDCITRADMYLSKLKILCVHDPIYATDKYDLVLHGHLHGNLFMSELIRKHKKTLLINVGVDCWKYKPVEWEKLFILYQQWKANKFHVQEFKKDQIEEKRQSRRI